MIVYLNAFEMTPTNKGEQRKNPKPASNIFQVVWPSLSEPESPFPYNQVPMARSTSYVKNISDDYLPDRLSKQFIRALITYLHSVTQSSTH